MKYTGERIHKGNVESSNLYHEHITRYSFAAQFVEGKKVLDLACGTGYGSLYLYENKAQSVVGVDIDLQTIETAQEMQKDNLIFKVGSGQQIPAAADSFDVVISLESIEHMKESDQRVFLREIVRVLVKGGLLVMSTPNAAITPKVNPIPNPHHLNELDNFQFQDLLQKNFKYCKFFSQDIVECSYVRQEESSLNDASLFDTSFIAGSDALYQLAVCSEVDLPRIQERVCLSNKRPWERYVADAQISQGNAAEIQRLEKLVLDQREENTKLYSDINALRVELEQQK